VKRVRFPTPFGFPFRIPDQVPWLFPEILAKFAILSVSALLGLHCGGVRMPIPFGQIPVGEGVLPDGGSATFFIDRRTLELLAEHGYGEKYHDARFLPLAVSRPDAIFQGLSRPNRHDGLCYSVRPESDPDDDGTNEPGAVALPRYGVTFLAFVEVRDMGYMVFDWEWRDEDPDEPGHPLGWKDDFAAKVYP
jgi:hypothetical protein